MKYSTRTVNFSDETSYFCRQHHSCDGSSKLWYDVSKLYFAHAVEDTIADSFSFHFLLVPTSLHNYPAK